MTEFSTLENNIPAFLIPTKDLDIKLLLDCSQSPIFSWDRLDILRLTVTAFLIFLTLMQDGSP